MTACVLRESLSLAATVNRLRAFSVRLKRVSNIPIRCDTEVDKRSQWASFQIISRSKGRDIY